ncbi:MAG: ATP-binding protein [Bacteroidota bacterium]|nr:ATP-binding protein [Bacteroidota bacterium]
MRRNTFITELIKQDDNIQVSFITDYNLMSILSTVCAFLNTDGGWIIVGHSGNKLVGLENIDQKSSEVKNKIAEKIIPQPLVYVQDEAFQKKDLLLINVLKGTRQPYSFEGKNYIRKGNKSTIANPDEISLLLRRPNEFVSTWEKLTAIDAAIEDLVQREIKKTISDADKLGRGKSLPNDPENFLNYFQLFDNSAVKNGAIVVFGKYPVKFLPQCRIRLTVMPHGKTGSRYEDSLIIEDHLFKAFEQVHNYFKQQLPMVSEFKDDDWIRSDHERYPLEALDEAIVNAMVHRDYGDISGEVSINIYRDRIEITNSGEIPEGILKNKNSFEIYHAVFRNPMIAHMFFLRGKMEKKGRGLLLIKNRCTEYGLKAPAWVTQNGYTSLTLYGIPKPVSINDRMVDFGRRLKTGEQFTREDYEQYFKDKISEKTARNDISNLESGGWVRKSGKGPSTKYTRTNKELPDNAG